MLQGHFVIRNNVIISGSNISTRKHGCAIQSNTRILNQNFIATGSYDNNVFNDEYFKFQSYNGIDLIMTKHTCRVFCLTMTYQEAWVYLHKEEEWNKLYAKYMNSSPSKLFVNKDIKNWLIKQCEIGLNKLRQG
jgi:hypothetical protein